MVGRFFQVGFFRIALLGVNEIAELQSGRE